MLSNNKLTLLHAIRGFAAFYVVIYHAKFPLWVGGKEYLAKYPRDTWNILDYLIFGLDLLTSQGGAMVILFFVLSGFFIAYSFDKNKWGYKDFYINRAIRIYIPFIASLLFSILVLYVVEWFNPALTSPNITKEFNDSLVAGYQNLTISNFFTTLVFLPFGENVYVGFNIVYWSLLYEAIYYLFIPLIINRVTLYLIVSVIALSISMSGLYVTENPVLKFFLDFSFYFAMGMQVFHLIKGGIFSKRLPLWVVLPVLGIFFLAVILLGLKNHHQEGYLFAGLLGAGLIILFIIYDFKENPVFRIFKSLGVISYSLYLFHFPVLVLLYAILNKITGEFLFYSRIYWIGVILAVLFSYLMYYLIEDKSLTLISKLKNRNKVIKGNPAALMNR